MLRINLIKQPTSTVDWIDFQEGDVFNNGEEMQNVSHDGSAIK